MHYVHTRLAYYPNHTEMACCQCCEDEPYVLSRVANETKNFPMDGIFVDNAGVCVCVCVCLCVFVCVCVCLCVCVCVHHHTQRSRHQALPCMFCAFFRTITTYPLTARSGQRGVVPVLLEHHCACTRSAPGQGDWNKRQLRSRNGSARLLSVRIEPHLRLRLRFELLRFTQPHEKPTESFVARRAMLHERALSSCMPQVARLTCGLLPQIMLCSEPARRVTMHWRSRPPGHRMVSQVLQRLWALCGHVCRLQQPPVQPVDGAVV
jgi:hypothetical protein